MMESLILIVAMPEFNKLGAHSIYGEYELEDILKRGCKALGYELTCATIDPQEPLRADMSVHITMKE